MRSSIIRGVAAAVFALALCTVTAQETSLKTVQDFETLFNERQVRREIQELLDAQDFKAAAKAYEKLVRDELERGDVAPAVVAMDSLAIADCYLAANKASKARKAYTKVLKEYPYYIPMPAVMEKMRGLADDFANGRGTVFGLKDTLASIEIYRQIIAAQPDIRLSFDDRMVLAGKLEREYEYTDAVNCYQETIKLAPRNPDVRLALARLLYRLACDNDGDGQRSRAAIREARSFLEFSAQNDLRRPEAEQIVSECREQEAWRVVKKAEFYLNKYHYRADVARRYLYDVVREFPETRGALQANVLLDKHFQDNAEVGTQEVE